MATDTGVLDFNNPEHVAAAAELDEACGPWLLKLRVESSAAGAFSAPVNLDGLPMVAATLRELGALMRDPLWQARMMIGADHLVTRLAAEHGALGDVQIWATAGDNRREGELNLWRVI